MDYKIVLMKDAEEDFESLNQLTDYILKIERYIKNDARLSIFLYLCLKKSCNAQGSSEYYLFVTAPLFLNSRGEHWYSFLNTLQK